MNLQLNTKLADGYVSNSQIARVLTEDWVKNNTYCPQCGAINLDVYKNNKPVADFFCKLCMEDFELKSKNGILSNKIVDGAYHTMIDRIASDKNPNFFFLTYNKSNWSVNNFIIIPKHFFVKEIIQERKPLAVSAKRAGWIGCNIDLLKIPELGKIYLIKNASIIKQGNVLANWSKTLFLKNKPIEAKGWTLEILRCIDRTKEPEFKLEDIYEFEKTLQAKYPNNHFIKDKIRQQVQILRDKGIIEFKSKGVYRKISE